MSILLKKLLLITIISITSLTLFSQNSIDQSLAKLNRIHKKGRLMFTTKTIPEIFLNKADKILDMGAYFISIYNVKISYSLQSRNSPTLKYHGVKFSCSDGENCIEVVEDGYAKSMSSFFKTKKDCYDFINAYNELKSAFN